MRNEIKEVRTMLEALLMSNNHIHWIGGYVYGRTAADDPFIILYPSSDKLIEKACRVYPHDFKKLPKFIDTENIPVNAPDGNPNKQKAAQRGIYRECPPFQIVTYDGRETQMGNEKRFGGVVKLSRAAHEAVATTVGIRPFAPQSPPGQPQQPQQPQRRIRADERQLDQKVTPAPAVSDGPITRAEQAVRAESAQNFDHWAMLHFQEEEPGSCYTEVARVRAIRELIMGDRPYELQYNEAMINALAKYGKQRSELQKTHSKEQAHSSAITAAKDRFNRLVREGKR